jgi:hypothetical protein
VRRTLLALLALAGCDKVLGLDRNTLLTDGPLGTCEGPSPACDTTNGETICGRLLGAGAMAGVPFEVAEPTGEICAAGVTDGPCAYTVGGMPMSSFFGGQTNQAMGFIDDCGRYTVPTLVEPDVAVILTGPDNVNTAAIARARTIEAGTFTSLDVVVAGDTAKALWVTQVPGATAFDSGYLVRYSTGTAPRAGEATTLSGGNPLPTSPSTSQSWVSYFADDGGFGSLDPAATLTSAAGTAFVAPIAIPQPFILEGFRVGRRCMIDGLQTVQQRLIFVEPTDC